MYYVLLIVFLLGTLNGAIVQHFINKRRNVEKYMVGNLRIDSSEDSVQPYIFLELEKNIDNVKNHQYIWLRINRRSYLEEKDT